MDSIAFLPGHLRLTIDPSIDLPHANHIAPAHVLTMRHPREEPIDEIRTPSQALNYLTDVVISGLDFFNPATFFGATSATSMTLDSPELVSLDEKTTATSTSPVGSAKSLASWLFGPSQTPTRTAAEQPSLAQLRDGNIALRERLSSLEPGFHNLLNEYSHALQAKEILERDGHNLRSALADERAAKKSLEQDVLHLQQKLKEANEGKLALEAKNKSLLKDIDFHQGLYNATSAELDNAEEALRELQEATAEDRADVVVLGMELKKTEKQEEELRVLIDKILKERCGNHWTTGEHGRQRSAPTNMKVSPNSPRRAVRSAPVRSTLRVIALLTSSWGMPTG
ncbi:hypothetical protein CspHIS471_0502440 [Cutaneotrichosporon sp. HIS471]|nr:hypothetical protein CspHIS471_0502440 [Cutaneotrichosporon sp. HIS471]